MATSLFEVNLETADIQEGTNLSPAAEEVWGFGSRDESTRVEITEEETNLSPPAVGSPLCAT